MFRKYNVDLIWWLYLFICSTGLPAREADHPADSVNPFIGTANSLRPSVWESNGGTYPGAALPFGMVQATPEGYRYADKTINWFSFLNHTSGYPNGSSGAFYLMPYIGTVKEGQQKSGSAFSHDNEIARPGYYSVQLQDFDVKAELSVTPRAAICRFYFPQNNKSKIIFNDFSNIEKIGAGGIQGERGNWFFYAKQSQSIQRDSLLGTVYYVEFPTVKDQPLLLKIGFSKTSIEAAKQNLQSEIPAWDFETVQKDAYKTWNKHLSLINVSGGRDEYKQIFYTALYHSFLDPHLESDVCQKPRYSQLSPWDTFRSKQPLVTLLLPDRQLDMINSVLACYREIGHLPEGPMTGNHNIPIIVDSYMKEVRDFDVGLAYEAMRKAVLDSPFVRSDIGKYIQFGYVPAEQSYSVTKTLEYAYDDWALAQLAGKLGFIADRNELLHRAHFYRNIFNPETKFMQAKTTNGLWEQEGFREGDKWTYSWFVPHDIRGLINLMGGDELFVKKLDECFRAGYYVHDNEPALHYTYLFNYAGAPWLTQEWVDQVRRVNYSTKAGGLPGNDDLGALSAWYVFSALGFYPVCPGRPVYDLGLPLFEAMDIQLQNGLLFKVKAPGISAKNKYVTSIKLNGTELSRNWISHNEIINGGELIFEMDSAPSKSAVPINHPAESMTSGRPDFEIQKFLISKNRVYANEPFTARIVVWNRGTAAGTCDLDIFINDKKFKTESVIVDSGATFEIETTLRLYEPGQHSITLASGLKQSVTVKAAKPTIVFNNLEIPSPPVIRVGEAVLIKVGVQNIGSYTTDVPVALTINGQADSSKRITLKPGEQKTITFEKRFDKNGIFKIGLSELPPKRLKVYTEGSKPKRIYMASQYQPLLLLPFDGDSATRTQDLSGAGNILKVHNNVKWVPGIYGNAIQTNSLQGAFVEITESPELKGIATSKSLTMMAWIYPMEEKNFADFFTKGDWNVLQVRASNTAVNFYSGGYQRGEAYSRTTGNWDRHWHHIAGVTEGNYQKLYIDGQLLAEKEMEITGPDGTPTQIGNVNVPWCIGRNAQNPERIFNGYIDDVRIYLKPLPQSEIVKIILNTSED